MEYQVKRKIKIFYYIEALLLVTSIILGIAISGFNSSKFLPILFMFLLALFFILIAKQKITTEEKCIVIKTMFKQEVIHYFAIKSIYTSKRFLSTINLSGSNSPQLAASATIRNE
jgi:hypothetical protein